MLPENTATGPIAYDARSFIINGKRELLVGGEFHYFRTPNELWEDRIIKMKRSGSNQVTTYIPWNWHEPVEGQPRWTGDADLRRFLDLCTKHGMFIVVKPGPYICAEWDFGGHPDWLLSKKIRLRVLNDEYLGYVDKWYKQVADVIRPYLITNGGRIIAIQVENEYDHLIHYGDERIPIEDAITYFKRLEDMMNRYGIDIPKFANEAAFLRGSSIIDTRTYYPSIPWFWKWELENYDRNIDAAKKGQPDCPTMILELQSGWFTMFGQPPYVPDSLLTEAVTNSALMASASFLNLYMFVGGTTFPFWGCRGDIFDLYPPGTGTTTSFDFGGSPIREWGELMPGRYDWVKIFNTFCRNFQSLLIDSDMTEEVKVLGGGEGVELITEDGSKLDTVLASSSERFKVVTRKRDDERLVCVRNMSDDDKTVDIGWTDSGASIMNGLEVRTHECFILPLNVKIPGTDIRIEYSSSSLLFSRKLNNRVVFGLFGKPGRAGQMGLNVPASEVKVLFGDVKVEGGDKAVLSYTHKGLQVVSVRGHEMLILDQDLASRVEETADGIVIADTYYVEDMKEEGGALKLKAQMRNDSRNQFFYIGNKALKAANVNGQTVELKQNGPVVCFEYKNPAQEAVTFKWNGGWKVKPDVAEAQPKYKDADWRVLEKPISLEEAGLLKHGFLWYRMDVRLPEGAKDVNLAIPCNETDRIYVYVNGREIWSDIKKVAEMGITDHIKPGKNTIAVLYENFYHNKSHPHEGAIQKYSGIMGPVLVTGTGPDGKPFKKKIAKMKVREQLAGDLAGYANEGLDDSKWHELTPAAKYVMSPELGTLLWMRRKFSFSCGKGWHAGVKLTIPNAKDRLLMYVNGRPLGQFEHIGPQYDFYIPETFLKEENVLTFVLAGHKTFKDTAKGFLKEPILGTFFEAKSHDVQLDLG